MNDHSILGLIWDIKHLTKLSHIASSLSSNKTYESIGSKLHSIIAVLEGKEANLHRDSVPYATFVEERIKTSGFMDPSLSLPFFMEEIGSISRSIRHAVSSLGFVDPYTSSLPGDWSEALEVTAEELDSLYYFLDRRARI